MSTVSARHILVENKHEADDLLKKMADGSTFEELAKSFSKCPSGKEGGSLGEFGRGQMVKPFEDAAFSLEVDQVSEPIQTQFGYHLIQRIG